ncbi:hypothetical protein ACFV1G_34600 [Streptomyces anulatus]|uniref:hypothetical protein n=1 Tax=Streptomyces anulatus TaxID=1892 RepID=UPI0036D18B7A
MNDALDRREESGPDGRLDQVVFRWDGNQGRSSTGMAAVAHSCSAERAESLRRELGPLLWVPGPGPAPRASSVRVSSRAVGTVLLQRWPTKDRGGRPSTACHAVFGDAHTLTPLHCLGLGNSAWSRRDVAETVTGGLPTLNGARLRATAGERLRTMTEELPTVRKPLAVVVAEWLRDPSRRLSLLAEENDLPDWPRLNRAPLLYLGLLSVFGDWFGTEWSYATYDTVDTHPLRLTCVPGWTSQAANARSLARIRLRLPAEKDVEMSAAVAMVDHLLGSPGAAPGVPHLAGELRSGAQMSRPERREALRRMLNARNAPAPRRKRERDREDRYEQDARYGQPERYEEERYGQPEPYEQERYGQPEPYEQEERYGQPEPYEQERYEQEEWYEHESRSLPETRSAPEERHAAQRLRAPEGRHTAEEHHAAASRHEQERRRLHDELLVHQRVDTAQSARLAARLRDLRDDPLLTLLCSDGLPWASRDLVLDELAVTERRRSRDEATAHALCTEVLRHNLYFRPGRPEADSPSVPEMRERAAELFSWAVAPLVRDPHRAPDLRPLFNIVLKDGRETGMEWLRRILVAPPDGRVPDLPPQLWQQIVTGLLAHPVSVTTPGPAPVPAPAQPPAPTAAAPAHAPTPTPAAAAAPAPARPPVTLPASYTPATAPPTLSAPAPKPSAPPSPVPAGPEQEKPILSSGFSDFLYGAWFAPVIGVLVVAVIIGLVVLVAR